MSLATTLMAVGLPAEQANRLGYEDRVPLDGNGTTQGSATELMATQTNVALGTSVGDTAFRLPAEAEYFQEYFLLNTTAETALIFPPVGDTIDANALNAAVEVETDLARVFQRVEEGRWVSFPSGEGGGGIESIVAGAGISVDNTDPDNPVVSNTGVLSVSAGSNVTITGTAQNPIINSSNPGGTVTAVSVASANGFAGSSSGGATPQLTLSTTVNAPILAGNGTAIAAATTTGTGTTAVLSASPALTGTPTAPTAAVDTNTTQLATTAMVLGQAAAATPLGNAATAVVGTSTRYARADHVHPGREVLTANRTYYVRTDGSDSNTGLANTSGGAFLTMQKAADVAYSLDFNDYTVTLKYGNDGTRTSGVTLAGLVPGQTSAIIIEGNTGNFSGVVISTTSANAITATDKAWVHVKALKVQTTTGGVGLIASDGARLETTNIVFGACATYQFNTTYSAHLTFHGSYEIAGGAVGHGHITTESGITWETGTITLTGTPAFSSFFLGMSSNANGEFQSVTFSGSATGPKALIHDGATLYAAGQSLDYLPGDSPMRVYGGGQYNDWSEPYYAYQALASDRVLADSNASQTLFASATDALSFSASETYLIEGEFLVTRAAGTTSHTITLAWGGALGTGGSAKWTYWVSNPTGNVLANVQEITSVDLADAVLTAANTSATENLRLRFRGLWRSGTTASLVQPNIRYSAAPGGAPTVVKGSWMRATKWGKSDIGAVGNWS